MVFTASDDEEDLVAGLENLGLSSSDENSPTGKTSHPVKNTLDTGLEDSSPSDKTSSSLESSEPESTETEDWTRDEDSNEFYPSDFNADTIRIPDDLYDRLYQHQKVGVKWLTNLYDKGIGGILGDDMGMGKTFQTLTLLGGLMRARSIRNALIVCPVSLLRTWEKEAQDVLMSCAPNVTIFVITSEISKIRRSDLLIEALTCRSKYPYLAITTYGLVGSSPDDIVPHDYYGRKTRFDYVVLDEGHKIKNPSTKVHKGCRRICKEGTHRLLLSGTPIQNNLKELWSLMDWATSGKLLGRLPDFLNQFAFPIEEGRHKDACDTTIKNAHKANKELQNIIHPHLLQRMKKTTFNQDKLPTKLELVVWTHLSPTQRYMYEDFVQNEGIVQSVLSGETKSPLVAITWLKKLCGHPSLVDDRQTEDINGIINDSAKLQALVALIHDLVESNHRTLVFSQSTKMLDIIQMALSQFRMLRIDGTTKEKDRQRFVNKFNKKGSKVSVMLLSTKAAGLGLTLTGADTAVIYDPSWNPADDSQAVDRCYRIGQQKKVTIYRLISAGTVEERMYEKQVHKDGIRRAVLTASGVATERHFQKDQLRRLFLLAPMGECEMLEKFKSNSVWEGCDETSFLEQHPSIIGVSPHDALYTNSVQNVDGQNKLFDSPVKHNAALGKAGRIMTNIDMNSDEAMIPLGKKKIPKRAITAKNKKKQKEIIYSSDESDENFDCNPSPDSNKENEVPQNKPKSRKSISSASEVTAVYSISSDSEVEFGARTVRNRGIYLVISDSESENHMAFEDSRCSNVNVCMDNKRASIDVLTIYDSEEDSVIPMVDMSEKAQMSPLSVKSQDENENSFEVDGVQHESVDDQGENSNLFDKEMINDPNTDENHFVDDLNTEENSFEVDSVHNESVNEKSENTNLFDKETVNDPNATENHSIDELSTEENSFGADTVHNKSVDDQDHNANLFDQETMNDPVATEKDLVDDLNAEENVFEVDTVHNESVDDQGDNASLFDPVATEKNSVVDLNAEENSLEVDTVHNELLDVQETEENFPVGNEGKNSQSNTFALVQNQEVGGQQNHIDEINQFFSESDYKSISSEKLNESQNGENKNTSESVNTQSPMYCFNELMKKANYYESNNQLEQTADVLLDALDIFPQELCKEKKLELHQKIALVAKQLDWLKS